MPRKQKLKAPHATLAAAIAVSSARPRILFSQGRAEHKDHGAREAATGGAFNASAIKPTNVGDTDANGPTETASASGSANAGKS
jgi:hypothetical protein